jgi:integrase
MTKTPKRAKPIQPTARKDLPGISREATIKRFMREVGYSRAASEEAVDEIDDYVADWGQQVRAYLDRHNIGKRPDGPDTAKREPKRGAIKLTDINIKALQPQAAVYEVPDTQAQGLRVVVQPTGGRSFAVRYWDKRHRKRAKIVLGRYPDLSLADARSMAFDVRSAVAKREDPAAKVRPSKPAEPRASGTLVETAWRRYQNFRRDVRHRRARTLDEANRIMHRDVLPKWKGRTLDQITADDVLEVVNAVAERGAPVGANCTLATLTAFFNWAVAGRILRSTSPCAGLKPPAEQKARERFLDQAEIVAMWKAAETLGNPIAAVTKLLLIFAARRGEIGGMAWSEINLDKRTWTLPAERSKNHNALELPLPDLAMDILTSIPRSNDLLFGFTDALWRSYKRQIDMLLPDLKPWTWHDLRRTAYTVMIEELDAAPHVVEAITNHVSGHRSGPAGVYNRAKYRPQMKLTLDKWCDYLDRIVTGRSATVIPMRG